jgi:hypothetical protein
MAIAIAAAYRLRHDASSIRPVSTATIRTRANPILVGTAAIAALAAIAAAAGWLPVAKSQAGTDRGMRPVAQAASDSGAASAACATCGIVEAVRIVEVRGDARAVGDSGRAGGTRLSYRVTVRMADGSYRTLAQPTPPSVAVGDRVRVAEGVVVREN